MGKLLNYQETEELWNKLKNKVKEKIGIGFFHNIDMTKNTLNLSININQECGLTVYGFLQPRALELIKNKHELDLNIMEVSGSKHEDDPTPASSEFVSVELPLEKKEIEEGVEKLIKVISEYKQIQKKIIEHEEKEHKKAMKRQKEKNDIILQSLGI